MDFRWSDKPRPAKCNKYSGIEKSFCMKTMKLISDAFGRVSDIVKPT